MKKCPYCAEEVQEEAKKCKHCMEFLDEWMRAAAERAVSAAAVSAAPENPIPVHLRTPAIVMTAMTVPPLALPLIWLRPKLHITWKIGWTVVILAPCWYMYKAIVKFVGIFNEAKSMLENGLNGF